MDIYDILDFILRAVTAAVMAIAAVWKFIHNYVDRKVDAEKSDRELADTRIEEKLRSNNDKIHVLMGKIELIDSRLQEQERTRMAEMHELKLSLQDGLHKIEIQLERIRQESNIKRVKEN